MGMAEMAITIQEDMAGIVTIGVEQAAHLALEVTKYCKKRVYGLESIDSLLSVAKISVF